MSTRCIRHCLFVTGLAVSVAVGCCGEPQGICNEAWRSSQGNALHVHGACERQGTMPLWAGGVAVSEGMACCGLMYAAYVAGLAMHAAHQVQSQQCVGSGIHGVCSSVQGVFHHTARRMLSISDEVTDCWRMLVALGTINMRVLHVWVSLKLQLHAPGDDCDAEAPYATRKGLAGMPPAATQQAGSDEGVLVDGHCQSGALGYCSIGRTLAAWQCCC
jgi:hypothetical protein